jgi:RHS repeat-associated protein
MTGGWAAGTYYDTGILTAEVSGTEVQLPWAQGSTLSSLAISLAEAINTDVGLPSNTSCPTPFQLSSLTPEFVTACASDATVKLTSQSAGPDTDYSVTANTVDTNPTYFSPNGPNQYTGPLSFSVATTNMGGGANDSTATHATGSFTFSGTDQSLPATYASGTITVSGMDQTTGEGTVSYDSGAWNLSIGSGCAFVPGQNGPISYGAGSTAASVAFTLYGAILDNCPQVTATVSGEVVTVTSTTPGTGGDYSMSASLYNDQFYDSGLISSPSFTLTPSGSTLTTGSPVYDTGSYLVSVSIGSSGQSVCTASVPYGQGSTLASLAATLAVNINSSCSSLVTASNTFDSPTVTMTSVQTGAGTDGDLIEANMTGGQSLDFPTGSFTLTPSGSTLTGGQGYGAMFYTYLVPAGGYAPNGNLLSVADSITGAWNYTYDNLNRLAASVAGASGMPGAQDYYAGTQGSWGYDAFGNRRYETLNGLADNSPPNSMPSSSTAYYTAASNQISSFTYDAAGDVTYDGLNSYLYDAEGRLCAVSNYVGALTGYIYDAAGTRVAKGTLSSWPTVCVAPTTANGFTLNTSWVLGPGGEQVTEYALSGTTSTWQHTNAFAGGRIEATYHDTNTYFYLADWLGTKRAEVGTNGCVANYASLPYGDGLSPVSVLGYSLCVDATEHHFTGKERDTESGNDYFGARYYASTMGRFMSPDPLPWIHWQNGNRDDQQRFEAYIANPQNFNMYAYVNNNPLNKTDPTGMNACGTKDDSSCKVTITIRDRSTGANGKYNDQFTGVKNQGNYNATAVVNVNGKDVGTFLIKTTPSDSSTGAPLAAGVYGGTLTTHNGNLAIRIQPTDNLPTNGANPGQHGAWFAQGDLIHQAGGGQSGSNFTGVGHDGRAVSNGCLVVCTTQFGDFEGAAGMNTTPPQRHFTIDVDAGANGVNADPIPAGNPPS